MKPFVSHEQIKEIVGAALKRNEFSYPIGTMIAKMVIERWCVGFGDCLTKAYVEHIQPVIDRHFELLEENKSLETIMQEEKNVL